MLASQYPLLDIFLSILYFFLLFVWIYLLVVVIFDIFRSHDLGGWAKAAWVLLIIILPLLGVLIYLIARGSKMHQHAVQDAKAQDTAFRQYVQDAAGSSPADELTKLSQLRDQGVITPEEFEQQKAKILS
ncbi:MAG TPA: SHOCT domain-containing protein [Acidimicrobiales bacterium]|nr:SHOCT domain-containing protein [Acidimicrobiales bacterium]